MRVRARPYFVNVPVPVPEKSRNCSRIGADGASMQHDHEKLDVYHLALDFVVFANGVIEALPRGRSRLADQFTRASMSIVLNLAEGAGKHSRPDKRRFYVTARGSATESAALLDICLRLKPVNDVGHKTGKEMLLRIVSMLIKLAQACDG